MRLFQIFGKILKLILILDIAINIFLILSDINNNLIQFVSQTHIEWMCEAITTIDISSDKDLIVSICKFKNYFEIIKFKLILIGFSSSTSFIY